MVVLKDITLSLGFHVIMQNDDTSFEYRDIVIPSDMCLPNICRQLST